MISGMMHVTILSRFSPAGSSSQRSCIPSAMHRAPKYGEQPAYLSWCTKGEHAAAWNTAQASRTQLGS